MSQSDFSQDWLRQFSSDPYAVLGLSVTVDDARVQKRYRTVAKLLHPDRFTTADAEVKQLATQLFARLVNPAYQQLKQEKGRAEHLAMLRFRVRRMNREEPIAPQSELARELTRTVISGVDIFYEQGISQLAEAQYQSIDRFEAITQELAELNLVYLRLKMGEPMIREKRNGLVPASTTPQTLQFTPPVVKPEQTAISYAQRHYLRAQEYVKKSNWSSAIQELRDAIRLEPDHSEYHSLIAKVYLMQNLAGMAKVHFRQALKLNPKDPLALEYVKKLDIKLDPPATGKNKTEKNSGGGFFGLFAKKR